MTDKIKNKNTTYDHNTKTNPVFSVKVFNIFFICLLVLTGFLYLTQVNATAVKGYIIQDLEAKLEETKLNNKRLELQSQSLQSVSGITNKVQELGMVAVDQVEYLQAPGGEVAVAK